MMEGQTSPGWYVDATNPNQERYWNGEGWTTQYRPVNTLEQQILQELKNANRLLVGIQQRTGVVAVAVLVALVLSLIAALAIGNDGGEGSDPYGSVTIPALQIIDK
jgi:hypothetical protein